MINILIAGWLNYSSDKFTSVHKSDQSECQTYLIFPSSIHLTSGMDPGGVISDDHTTYIQLHTTKAFFNMISLPIYDLDQTLIRSWSDLDQILIRSVNLADSVPISTDAYPISPDLCTSLVRPIYDLHKILIRVRLSRWSEQKIQHVRCCCYDLFFTTEAPPRSAFYSRLGTNFCDLSLPW